MAIRRTLERERPLAGAESAFLEAVSRAAQAPPELFGRVWADPRAYYWTRMAYRLLAACLSGEPLDELGQAYCRAVGAPSACVGLERHLADFQRFAVALAGLGHERLDLPAPLRVRLPFAVPGTRFAIEGEPEALLLGVGDAGIAFQVSERRLELRLRHGAAAGPLAVAECPVVRVEGCEVRLQAAAFDGLHGLDFVAPVLEAGAGFQRRHAELFAQALLRVARHAPDTFEQLRDTLEIVGLKPLRSGGYTNIAHSELPGAFVAGVVANPYELADTVVHEFHHNRLFALEEHGPFFDDTGPDPVTDLRFYSPWRDDLRSLHGLLHGAYVFVPVWWFWRDVVVAGGVAPDVERYARERLARVYLQLEIALSQLASFAHLTDHGAALVRELTSCVAAMSGELPALEVSFRAPAMRCDEQGRLVEEPAASGVVPSVLGAVRDHARRFAPPTQAPPLLALPSLAPAEPGP